MEPPGPWLRLIAAREADLLRPSWTAVVDLLQAAFDEKARGLVENPAKPAVHPRPGAFAHAMPAYLSGSDALGCKWVSGYPRTTSVPATAVRGLVIVNDPASGQPVSVIDGGLITAVRTAGVSALVARRFAPDAHRLAIVGCGREGMAHLEALLEVCPGIAEVSAYNPRVEKAELLLEKLDGVAGVVATNPEDAIRDCDLVVTATPMDATRRKPLSDQVLAPDALLMPIDFDRCWSGETVRGAKLFCVDDRAQFDHLRGEAFDGYPEPGAELAELLAIAGEVGMAGLRVFLATGLAMADIALGAELWRRAAASGIGTDVAWPDATTI